MVVLAALATGWLMFAGRTGEADPDTLRHLKWSALYLHHGPLFHDFRWLPLTVFGRWHGDLWYGYHVLCSPLALLADPELQVRLGGVLGLAALLALVYLAARRLRLPAPALWAWLAVFAAPGSLSRCVFVRPHVLSEGLVALLLALLLTESVAAAGLVTALLLWLHLMNWWLVAALLVAVAGWQVLVERRAPWRLWLAVLLGASAGWLLRPAALDCARLAWVQIVTLGLAHRQQVPLQLADELDPMELPRLWLSFGPFLVVWTVGAVAAGLALVRRWQDLTTPRRRALGVLLGLSYLFFVLTLFVAMRFCEQWVLCSALMLGATVDVWLGSRCRGRLVGLAAVVVLALGCRSAVLERAGARHLFLPLDRFRDAALWLAEHGEPEAVVANVHWESFGDLLYFNDRQRYVWGMDPIFLYAENPAACWVITHLANRHTAALTAPEPICTTANAEPTVAALRRYLDARYVVFDPRVLPELDQVLLADPGTTLRFQNATSAIFELPPVTPAIPEDNPAATP